jgi:hypothetical protein
MKDIKNTEVEQTKGRIKQYDVILRAVLKLWPCNFPSLITKLPKHPNVKRCMQNYSYMRDYLKHV